MLVEADVDAALVVGDVVVGREEVVVPSVAGAAQATTVTTMTRAPNPQDAFRNFRDSDLPLLEKVRLTIKNTSIKVKNRSNCCGNHGEPGC